MGRKMRQSHQQQHEPTEDDPLWQNAVNEELSAVAVLAGVVERRCQNRSD